MNTTENLGLKMPETTDYRDVADLNYNMQVLDTIVYALYTHAIKNISVSGNTITCTREDGSTFTVTHANASTSAAGLMAAADKSKLDGIQAGAQVNPGVATTGAPGLCPALPSSSAAGKFLSASGNWGKPYPSWNDVQTKPASAGWMLKDPTFLENFLSLSSTIQGIKEVTQSGIYYVDITGNGKVIVSCGGQGFGIADSADSNANVHHTALVPLEAGVSVIAEHTGSSGSTKVYRLYHSFVP